MKSVFSIFHKGLRKTAISFSRKIGACFSDSTEWNDDTFEALEEALIGSDFGLSATLNIVDNIRKNYMNGEIKTSHDIVSVTKNEIKKLLDKDARELNLHRKELTVIILVGVNGSGKTTTAGKLAYLLNNDGKKVMLAACDTFRAAAVDQLKLWGNRINSHVIAARHGADPSSVAYDAVKSAIVRNFDFLIIDTAGRQHNHKGLMDELAKMNRSIKKVYPNAPQEVWLVVDGSVGSNALMQAKEFSKFSGVNGLVFTKLDGTGKGGMVVAIKNECNLPAFFVGLGEQPEDLQPFDSKMFTDALFEEFTK